MVKYIGSKRVLLPWIIRVIESIVESNSALRDNKQKGILTLLDPFSGTARVGHALKQQGYFVIAGDYLSFAYILAKALVEADAREYPAERILPLLSQLNALPGRPGWFTEYYAIRSRFLQPHNAAKIEAIREAIEEVAGQDERLKAILLTSLLLAADKVDSTTGLQMAYLKKWAPRSYNELHLEYPPLVPGRGQAVLGDALSWALGVEADIAYLDPPYNQHSYAGNYHVWETLVLFDKPEIYGVACKRADVRQRKSPFNSKVEAPLALSKLLHSLRAPYIVLSFSDEGFFSAQELKNLCESRGPTLILKHPYKRYVGAQIGIYNPHGEKVGKVSHLYNNEYLYIICPDSAAYLALKERLNDALLPHLLLGLEV
ncbi:MAG: DNA adenine methylase [Bacteroidia bacterium]|nr:DNA adenine methylase [Bacteroidia bacterium]